MTINGKKWIRWCGVFLAACLIRGGWLSVRSTEFDRDPDGYGQLAETLANEGVFGYQAPTDSSASHPTVPTAFRPPLYPLLLAGIGAGKAESRGSVAALHFVLGVASVLLTWLLAEWWQLSGWGLLAALLVTVDPILLNQSGLLMTETLATFLAVVSLLALTWFQRHPAAWRGLICGCTIGVAALCRPTFLAWLPLAAILVYASSTPRPNRSGRWMPSAVILVGALVVLSPWIVRNYLRFGRFLVGTSHGGYTLMLGNNPGFYAFLRTAEWGDVWDSQSLDAEYNAAKTRLAGDEMAADRWAYQQAFRCMREDPRMFCYSTLVRITRLWGCIPHQVRSSESTVAQLARWAVGAWYVMVYALALVGVFHLGRRLLRLPWAWGLALCLAFTAVHALYWSNLRMRAPLIPVVCLVAAVGAARLSSGKRACLYPQIINTPACSPGR